MPKVCRLAYVDLGTDDLARDRDFYVDAMGLQPVAGNAEASFLSLGYDAHNLCLRHGAESLPAVGYQLSRDVDLQAIEALLEKAGIATRRRSDSRPGVPQLLECEPLPGHRVQLLEAMDAPAPGFSERGVSPIRLGHFAFFYPSAVKLSEFYQDLLGFHHTDSFGTAVNFYTCNYEHHVLNIVDVPVPAYKLHHLAFQLRDYAAHARAADVLSSRDTAILWGPTRHTAGHNIASYFRDPQGRLIELYADMDVYMPDLGMMEPRPWHKQLPMLPQQWARGNLANWNTHFEFDLAKA